MRRDLVVLLEDMLEAGNDILAATQPLNELEYRQNRMLRRGVERSFEIIGEACRQSQRHFPGSLDAITSIPKLIAFRNHLAHEYNRIDDATVWQITREFLPAFVGQVNTLLKKLQAEAR